MTNSGGEPIEIDAIGAEQSWQEWVLMNLALVPFVWKLLGGCNSWFQAECSIPRAGMLRASL